MDAIKRDIYVLRDTIQYRIEVTRGTNMIPIELTIRDFNIPTTATAVAYAFSSRNDEPSKMMCDIVENTIKFTPSGVFFENGLNQLMIRIINDGKRLISFEVPVWCKDNKIRESDKSEEDQQTLIEQLLEKNGNLTDQVTNVEASLDEKATKKEVDVERKRIDNLVAPGKSAIGLAKKQLTKDANKLSQTEGSHTHSTSWTSTGSDDDATFLASVKDKNVFVLDCFCRTHSSKTNKWEKTYHEAEAAITINGDTVTVSATYKTTDTNTDAAIFTVVLGYDEENREIADIRVDSDGVTHDSAGAAVRAQTKDVPAMRDCLQSPYVDVDLLELGNINKSTGAEEDSTKILRSERFRWNKGSKITAPSGYVITIANYTLQTHIGDNGAYTNEVYQSTGGYANGISHQQADSDKDVRRLLIKRSDGADINVEDLKGKITTNVSDLRAMDVIDKMQEEIENVQVETDPTLENEGMAADAAETGRRIAQVEEDLEGLTYTYTYEKNLPLNKYRYLIVDHKFEKSARIVVKCADNIGITILKNGEPEVLRQYGVVPVTVIDVKANDYVDTIEFSGYSNPTANILIELNSSEKIENETISDDLVVHNYGTLVKHYYYGYEYSPNNNRGNLKSNELMFCTNKLPIIKGKDIYIDSTGACVTIFYDINGDILLFRNISFGNPILSTDIPSDAYYVAFSLNKSYPIIESGESAKLNTNTYDNKYVRRSVSKRNYRKHERLKTYVYSSDSLEIIVEKMNEAFVTGNVDVFFEYGTYNLNGLYSILEEKYTFTGSTPRGILIGGNCRYFFNNAKLVKDKGDDPNSYSTDILEGTTSDNSENCDYEIHDLNIIGTGITYCIHDDTGTKTITPTIRKYYNCNMIYNATESSTYLSKCIGGGTGRISYREIKNCTFKILGESSAITTKQEVSYHGSSGDTEDGYLRLCVSGCYFENGIGQHGLDKKQTADFLMNNCSVATYTPVNTNGWTSNVWNNEIRNS